MRDVVVVGGGFTGLACAYALEQHGINVTLIELKRMLGGSLQSVTQDGFTIDTHAYAFMDNLPSDWLKALGLEDALIGLKTGVVAFKNGTQTLINALSERLNAPRMMRMAVSSIGQLENGRFGVCLENGVLLDTRAIVLAIPAKHAHFTLRSFRPRLSDALANYHYDTIRRVWLGYPKGTFPGGIGFRHEAGYVFHHRVEFPTRTPANTELVHVGTRIHRASDEAIVRYLTRFLNKGTPLFSHVSAWETGDSLSCYEEIHPERLALIAQELPEGVALIGSDYTAEQSPKMGIFRLDDRLSQATRTASTLATWLEKTP